VTVRRGRVGGGQAPCGGERRPAPGRVREACGVFAAIGVADAVGCTYRGLFAQQHRGQESAGIAAVKGGAIVSHLGMGLVSTVFRDGTHAHLPAASREALGHVRYSTTGRSVAQNAQPLVVRCSRGPLAVGHNGNLTNSPRLRRDLEATGSIFQGTADSEVILHMLARPSAEPSDLATHLVSVLGRLEGAYSLVLASPGTVYAARDPHGWRPLWLGRFPGGGHAVASETCGLVLAGATPVREVEPGELLVVTEREVHSRRIADATPAHCVFEHIYFARPDSIVFGDSVYAVRKALGAQLWVEQPCEVDVVCPIPDSGTPAALGYAAAAGVPFELGFVRSHYVGRTFIQPTRAGRAEGVSLKLAPVAAAVAGRRVAVVDDSIVRGTTARSRVRLLFACGAREVHLRISCPPIRHPCFFGVDFPDPKELIANRLDLEGIAAEIGATSVGYLSVDGLFRAIGRPAKRYCKACFTGRYPIEVPKELQKLVFEEGGPAASSVATRVREAGA